MPTLSELVHSDSSYSGWYQAERNTASLVQQVIADRGVETLSGSDLWNLFRLCWWTRSEDHWRRIKVPALAGLYKAHDLSLKANLHTTLSSASALPRRLVSIASKETGFVNFRPVWRQSSEPWCHQNAGKLRRLLMHVTKLKAEDDEERCQIARMVAALPRIPSPSGKLPCRAALLLTPFVMCLDPQGRFPVVNGREAVTDLLSAMELRAAPLDKQVEGMLFLLGRYTIADAMMIDVLVDSEQLRKLARALVSFHRQEGASKRTETSTPLRYYDDAEREATRKATNIIFRHLHNTMTKALGVKFAGLPISQGTAPNCRFDALVHDYDGQGRDLLIEAKPDTDRGSIRIAIGQLLDYRRFLPNPDSSDLAILTIGPPADEYLDLLKSLNISALWFTDEGCASLMGLGPAWNSIHPGRRDSMHSPATIVTGAALGGLLA